MPAAMPPAVQQLQVTSVIRHANFAFAPDQLTVQAGVPVRLTFDNRLRGPDSSGGVPHSFTMDLGRPGALVGLLGHPVRIGVAADSEATGEFVLAPGTYAFFCEVYDHRDAGMTREIIAE